MTDRKSAEEFIIKLVKDIDPTGYNVTKYKDIFSSMSDSQFNRWMTMIRNGEATIVFFAPHDSGMVLKLDELLEIAKKYGIKFFEKLIYRNDKNTPDYKTPIEYMVIDIPYKRQSQNLIKKISVPEHNKSIDQLTYQPTGESKGAKVSYPELQLLLGLGLEKSVDELIRFRGGDKNGFQAYNAMFMRYGTANLATLNNYSTGVESTKTLKAYLTAMHLSNTL